MARRAVPGRKVPVTRRALIQRINRKLEKRDERLRTKVGPLGAGRYDLGRFYIVDFRGNFLVNRDVDLEGLGRELKVLAKYEELAEGDEGRRG